MEMQFTSANFETEVLKSEIPVLVDFYADWCGPCKMMAPSVEKIADEFEGKATVGKLNIDDNEELALKYGIMSIPTVMVFKNGQILSKSSGLQNIGQLRAALNQAL